MKQGTVHLAQPQRSPPQMHGFLQRFKSKTLENKTRQDGQKPTVQQRQDKRRQEIPASDARARLWKARQDKTEETRHTTSCAIAEVQTGNRGQNPTVQYRTMAQANGRQDKTILQVKCRRRPPTRTATHTLCEPAQSKSIQALLKSRCMQNFTGKMPPTRTTTCRRPEPRPTLCASLRSRNACGD